MSEDFIWEQWIWEPVPKHWNIDIKCVDGHWVYNLQVNSSDRGSYFDLLRSPFLDQLIRTSALVCMGSAWIPRLPGFLFENHNFAGSKHIPFENLKDWHRKLVIRCGLLSCLKFLQAVKSTWRKWDFIILLLHYFLLSIALSYLHLF